MQRLRAAYLIIANTIVLLFLLIVGAHVCIKFYYHSRDIPSYSELPDVVKRNYAHMTAAEVDDLMSSTWSIRYQYASWVAFGLSARESRFVNIDGLGIRSNGGPRRDTPVLQDAIWFFGGSTAFGSGVGDEETIPAQLEKALARPVVNFGVPAYYSAQENMLMAQYLKFGYRPSLVLFLDGVNEACDIEEYQNEMKILFAKSQDYEWGIREIAEPLLLAFTRIRAKLGRIVNDGSAPPVRGELVCQSYGTKVPLREVHSRTLAERESLCGNYAIECVTLVQPFGGVHGRNEDPGYIEEDRKQMRDRFRHLEPGWRAAKAVFVTDSLDHFMKHAYVDDVHYSAEASKVIAKAIADKIRGKIRKFPASE